MSSVMFLRLQEKCASLYYQRIGEALGLRDHKLIDVLFAVKMVRII